MASIHHRIKERRRKLGLTQLDVSRSCGVTQQAFDRLENGKVIRPRYILELAAVLQTSPSWLLTGNGEENSFDAFTNHLKRPALSQQSDTSHFAKYKIPVFKFFSNQNNKINWDHENPISWVRPLPCLETSTRTAALYIQVVSLLPQYSHGDTAFIDRNKLPNEGYDCVIEDNSSTRLMRYIKADRRNYYFFKLSTNRTINVRKDAVNDLYKVVGVIFR
jgi:transcriptional regulator with XRE-family HTH domain